LRRVALPNKILLKNVRDKDLLIARVEFIQIGIGVLLAHVEPDHVVLPEIVVVVAEDADAEIRVVENEAAEIAHEWLDAKARGNEIVIVREITDVDFRERFLKRIPLLLARRVARVGEIARDGSQSGAESRRRVARSGK